MRIAGLIFCLFFSLTSPGQQPDQSIRDAFNRFRAEDKTLFSSAGLSIVEASTGKAICAEGADQGLTPASCLKLFTAAAAYDILGAGYRFTTVFSVEQAEGSAEHYLVIRPSGDPTLGSDRFPAQPDVIKGILSMCQRSGINEISGLLFLDQDADINPVPDGWISQDIGNYFGAGAWAFNWRENSVDLQFRSGRQAGDTVAWLNRDDFPGCTLINELRSGPASSGDEAYVYSFPYSRTGWIKGTIPARRERFSVSASMPDPVLFFLHELRQEAAKQGINIGEKIIRKISGEAFAFSQARWQEKVRWAYQSPSLDSMQYWFLHKSINLYGEAFVKAIAMKESMVAVTDTGLARIRIWLKGTGVPAESLRMLDGSGLSPANRVSAKAFTQLLTYAAGRPWFASFRASLPVINGIRMKDGYITGVRTYGGYLAGEKGRLYAFSLLVNQYPGSPTAVRTRIWQLLDKIKIILP